MLDQTPRPAHERTPSQAVTLAPECPGAARYIEHITAQGVVASIGHTQASAAEIAEAVSAGATLSTHLGNGAHTLLIKNREDGASVDRLVLTRDKRYTPAGLDGAALTPIC